jgi:hypothetical protein
VRLITIVMAVATVAVLIVFGVVAPSRAVAASTSLERALDYLSAYQKESGGFSSSSDQGYGATTWIVMAIAASGQNPASWTTPEGKDPVSFLRDIDVMREAETGEGANNPASFFSRLILAFAAAGRSDLVRQAGIPRVDLVQQLLEYQHAGTGNFSLSRTSPALGDVSTTIWAIMALVVAGNTGDAVDRAVAWLKEAQGDDGGYGWQSASMRDVDDTAAVVMALRAAGTPADDPTVQGCLEFMRTYQAADGGFRSWMSSASSSESTAWALGALAAAGESEADWRSSTGASPLTYIEALQQSNGLFAHSLKTTGDAVVSIPLLSTAYAVVALSGSSYPIAPGEQGARPDYLPRLDIVSPVAGTTLRDGVIQVDASVTDAETGIDENTIRVTLDGVDVTDEATLAEGSLALALDSLPQGDHSLMIAVKDRAGNTSSKTVPFYMAAYETTTTIAGTTTTTVQAATTTTVSASTTGSTSSRGGGSVTTSAGSGSETNRETDSTSAGTVEGGTGGSNALAGSTPPTAAAPEASSEQASAGSVSAQNNLSGYRVSNQTDGQVSPIKDFDAPTDAGGMVWVGGLVCGLAFMLGAGAVLSHTVQQREEQRLHGVVRLALAFNPGVSANEGGGE